jgi:hypothetical protein
VLLLLLLLLLRLLWLRPSRGHEVLVIVSDTALDFVKSAAARHSSNTTAESMNYILINLTHREFGQPKPLKLGEVPPPSIFAGELRDGMVLAAPKAPYTVSRRLLIL